MAAFDHILPDLAHKRGSTAALRKVFERSTPFLWTSAGILSVGLLGALDYLTGTEISFSFFYLAPIILVTWAVHQKMGVLLSLLSALTWLMAESAGDAGRHASASYFWNTLIHIGFFILLTQLISQLKETQTKEQLAARTDFVTGVANRRYFYEMLELEIERTRRYPQPMTVVYMDMDHFKQVNDRFGHRAGDEVLRWTAGTMKSQLRKTDIIARLGGDEFALLLPAAHLPDARAALSKLQATLMEGMRRRDWPVTFSIGVVVCLAPPLTAEQIVDRADQLMYEVKKRSKNDVRFLLWDGKYFTRS